GKPEVFLQTPADERNSSFSPDGKWLAYASNESGIYQVYVGAFPDTGGKWQISSDGGTYPMWSRSGWGPNATREEDLERSGRVCDEPFGESEDGQTSADALVRRG